MSLSHKRANDSPDMPSKRVRHSNSRVSKVSNDYGLTDSERAFIARKDGFFQQYVERLNHDSKAKAASTDEDDVQGLVAIANEYRRIFRDIENLYRRRCGRVLAMGSDDTNQLGVAVNDDDDKELEYPPTMTNTVFNDAIQVAAGGTHSVCLCQNGAVYTWGSNDDFALGRDVNQEVEQKPITNFPKEAQGQIVQVGAGDMHSIFLSIDGKVYVCGTYKDMDSGTFPNLLPGQQLKKGMKQKYPILVPFPKKVRRIETGGAYNAAILEDDTLWTWGMGHCGELARSQAMGAKLIDDPMNSGHSIYEVGKMFIGGMVLKTVLNEKTKKEEIVEDYEYNFDVITKEFLTPAPVEWATSNDYDVLDVACGEIHILVVARKKGQATTRVFSSGQNQYGQLGHGDCRGRHALKPIEYLDGKQIVRVSAAGHYSMAMDAAGLCVYSWGRSDYGQLGIYEKKGDSAGSFEDLPQLVPFPYETQDIPVRDIVAGALSAFAVFENGDVYSWGFNEVAQTGHVAKDRKGFHDIERPMKLNPMRYYKKKNPEQGTEAYVCNASGGGQHSLMVVHIKDAN